MKIVLCLFVSIVFFASPSSAQECPQGEIADCNGYCAPMQWLMDAICDDEVREYPEGSGYYVDFSCEDFMCDLFACDGCADDCPVGFVPDCAGNCVPGEWIQDGICDMGQRFYKGVPVDFSCQFFGCDMGDCAGPCWDDLGYQGLEDLGACCLGTECLEMTREECWTLGYTFIGSNTMCLPETCGCGEGWVSDCNGECVSFWDIGGAYCSHGEIIDYGNGPFELDLDCPALACGLSGCVGNCLGGCCTGAECITVTYYDCVEIGGLFLGSYVPCNMVDCAFQQQPIQLPDTELYWSGKLGEVENFPQWIISEEDLLVVGAVDSSNDEWKTAICVFRYNESEDEWDEEALLVAPDGWAEGKHASYTTDGYRIAVTSSLQNEKNIYRSVIDVFAFDGSQWLHEQTIDDSDETENDQYRWATSLDILGDVLVVGDPMYNFQIDTNHGAAHIYHHDVSTGWAYDSILSPWGDPPFPDGDDPFLGLSVALSDSVVAVASQKSILLYDISGESPEPLQHLRDMQGNFHPRHRSIDFDSDRLMTHVAIDDFGDVEFAGSRIFEFDGAAWSATATLIPFDIAIGTDWAGYIVDLQGDRAMITSPRDNDLGHRTGSAYIWEFDDSANGGEGEWVFKSKLWSDRAVGEDEFGIGGALHGSNAYLTGIVENPDGDGIKVFWPRGIAWTNPLGGNLLDAANWDPTMPITSDSVSFSLRSQTPIIVDQDFPFQHVFIGPGKYIFDLEGVDRTLGDGGETINLQGVPGIEAEFRLEGGILNVTGEIHIGEGNLPGKVSLVSNSNGQIGKILVDGFYLQHDAGELMLELQEPYPDQTALVQLSSVSPQLGGVLSLNLAEGYVPEDGDVIPLLTSEVIDNHSGQFSVILINDPLPEGLYIKLNYIETNLYRGTGGTVYAEVDQLSNLFGYGDPNSATVYGTATDLAVADIGGPARTADSFEDIIVTTTDSLIIFISDGNGGIDSQVTYSHASFTSLSSVDTGDLDGDGTIDIVVTNSGTDEFIPIYNELGDATLLSIGTPESTGFVPVDSLIIDIDGDLDQDVVVVCYGTTFSNGSLDFFDSVPSERGLFNYAGSVALLGNPRSVDPTDVNDTKDLDLFVSFANSNSVGKVSGPPALGSFDWVLESVTNVAFGPDKIKVGDLNGDGLADVVVSCPESDVLCVLTGQIDGSLSGVLSLGVGDEPSSLALFDFDNDGDEDIAIISSNENDTRVIALYRNDTSINGGNLMFAFDQSLDEGLNPILVSEGDIDGDAIVDLVSINAGASLRGTGNDVLNIRKPLGLNCVGDIDGNGVVDIDDLLQLIGAFGLTGPRPEDINGDEVVNIDDMLMLISAWGNC